MTSTARTDQPIPYSLTTVGDMVVPVIGVEQVIDADDYTVQVDVDTVLADVATALIHAVRREPRLWARVMSHAGSTTSPTQAPVDETVNRLVGAARHHGAHLITLTPDQAVGLAEALDEAATEPDQCVRCERFAVHRGKCAFHDPEAWADQ